MTEAADRVFVDGEIHTLTDPDETYEAVAVRDGEIVRLGSTYDVKFLAGADTERIDLDGRVLLPGFIDAHTHMETLGRYLVHADLSAAENLDEAVSLLRERAQETDASADPEWVLGYGYDESTWPEDRYLDREDLDAVSEDRPVVAFREDMHVASVNSVVLERHEDQMADADVHYENAEPTGVLVEEAVDVLYDAVSPDSEETGRLLTAAQARANELGVTGVHDMVRGSYAPEVYRDMDLAGDLSLRVRLNYWADHLDALVETGLRTNHGSEMVRTGAVKTYTDGSFGGRTARISEPYHDDTDEYGSWVVDPEELEEIVEKADEAGFQVTAHAIGDVAIDDGAPLAFGSDCMPLDPLEGVDHAVNTEVDAQRLSVTEALRAYTLGAAYAGFDEDRLGTVETGKLADFTVLEASPWETDAIREIDVAMTVVDGDVVYDGR